MHGNEEKRRHQDNDANEHRFGRRRTDIAKDNLAGDNGAERIS